MKHFVTFEGIDGSGKSTISKRVYEKMKTEGNRVVHTFEPTNSKIGKFVQECIRKQSDPFVTSFSFIADRIQHCAQIKEWLDTQTIVLCDRYADSTYAYQGAQLESQLKDPVRWLQELSQGRILVPDRTYLFVIDPKESLARIEDRDELIPFERLEFLTKVHQKYLSLAKGKRFLKVDATKPIEDLVELCYEDVLL